MAEVEDAPVAVAVDECVVGPGVGEGCPTAGTHHNVEAELTVHRDLASVDVSGERLEGCITITVRLSADGHERTP
ncbi:MAG: hypothetical protein P8127_09315 [Acidobacteriota bacterium]